MTAETFPHTAAAPRDSTPRNEPAAAPRPSAEGGPRFTVGTKVPSVPPLWNAEALDALELTLLRGAVFPEAASAGDRPAFVFLDPAASAAAPDALDRLDRILAAADRLGLDAAAVGHVSADPYGAGGFAHTPTDMEALDGAAFASAFVALRERLAFAFATAAPSRRQQIVAPSADAALMMAAGDLLSHMPAHKRPFVHLVLPAGGAGVPNAQRFGGLERFGDAVATLNGERETLFLYAWSRPLAHALTRRWGVTVRALDVPPSFPLATPDPAPPPHLTIGYFARPSGADGLERLAPIVRAANIAARSPQRQRFVVALPAEAADLAADRVLARERAALDAIADRNVALTEAPLTGRVALDALRTVDAVLVLAPASDGAAAPAVAQHAMAAGKLVLAPSDVPLPGTLANRVVRAPDLAALGAAIADLGTDLAALRSASTMAKATFWAGARPARLFAELLVGPNTALERGTA